MENRRTLILAHRGARKYAPENSISAFKKAIELKIDGVEFDVLPTADGVPVVIHDDNLQRLTGYHMHLHKLTFEEVKKIDIGSKFNQFYAGEGIPSLAQVLELFKDSGYVLNIELKYHPRQPKNFIDNFLQEVEKYPHPENIVISSFGRNLLYKIGRLAPQLDRALLIKPGAFFFLDAIFSANILRVGGINPHISILKSSLVKFARMRDWKLVTWTANEPAKIKRALQLDVDAIITDDPVLAKEMRGK